MFFTRKKRSLRERKEVHLGWICQFVLELQENRPHLLGVQSDGGRPAVARLVDMNACGMTLLLQRKDIYSSLLFLLHQ
jgi:hypothetical protein